MCAKKITGVLEHIIFALEEKSIDYTMNKLGEQNGFQRQIILKINYNKEQIFIYIIKYERRLAYYIQEPGIPKTNISKIKLLEKIKNL
jgi:hypothetical protein